MVDHALRSPPWQNLQAKDCVRDDFDGGVSAFLSNFLGLRTMKNAKN